MARRAELSTERLPLDCGHLDVGDGAVAQDLKGKLRARRPANRGIDRGLQPVAADAVAHGVHVAGKFSGEIAAAGAAEKPMPPCVGPFIVNVEE